MYYVLTTENHDRIAINEENIAKIRIKTKTKTTTNSHFPPPLPQNQNGKENQL
jgi:hypothetical protein